MGERTISEKAIRRSLERLGFEQRSERYKVASSSKFWRKHIQARSMTLVGQRKKISVQASVG